MDGWTNTIGHHVLSMCDHCMDICCHCAFASRCDQIWSYKLGTIYHFSSIKRHLKLHFTTPELAYKHLIESYLWYEKFIINEAVKPCYIQSGCMCLISAKVASLQKVHLPYLACLHYTCYYTCATSRVSSSSVKGNFSYWFSENFA